MKSSLLSITLLISVSLFAQPPAYFENDQEWSTSFSFYSPGITDCVQNSSYVDYVNGDTLIGGTMYKKIGRRFITSYFPMSSAPCPSDSQDDASCYRILRQSNDSIYEYLPSSNSEELVISYNLNVGDSFSLTNFVNQNYSVQQIDTISLNGQDHRVYFLDTLSNYVVIEGVGHYSSENGSFLDYWGFGAGVDHTTSLNCYAQNDTTYWSHPDITTGSCSYLHDLSISDLVSDVKFQLFPNPTNGVLNIESDAPISSIKIVSLTGIIVLEKGNLDGNNTVDLTSISKGNYMIIIRDTEGRQSIRSFQKL